MSRPNARWVALRAINAVVIRQESLSNALSQPLSQLTNPKDRGLAQELSYGVLRWYSRLQAQAQQLLSKPMKAKDRDLLHLILLGLYQLDHTRIPAHAAVAETVALTRALKKPWASGLVNALLRRHQREGEADDILENPAAEHAHPEWLLERLQLAWPEEWPAICRENNSHPPMWLRTNPRHHSRDHYLALLEEAGIEASAAPHNPTGIRLAQPLDVRQLPGFEEGWCSVQDGAAQLAAPLLNPSAGERLLDACAAPGGKSCHLLEQQPELKTLWALDVDAERLQRVEENLARLGLQARVVPGDGNQPQQWWDGEAFDRILLDAPCSATGVIRRHPDIKWLRRDADIDQLMSQQRQLLEQLWPLLTPGGQLLYATCSILPQENAEQVAAFVERYSDAELIPIDAPWGRDTGSGRQILPGEESMDGFFYALLQKRAAG